jgi:hypothetical protein
MPEAPVDEPLDLRISEPQLLRTHSSSNRRGAIFPNEEKLIIGGTKRERGSSVRTTPIRWKSEAPVLRLYRIYRGFRIESIFDGA